MDIHSNIFFVVFEYSEGLAPIEGIEGMAVDPTTGLPLNETPVPEEIPPIMLQMNQKQGCNCPCNQQPVYPGYAPLSLPALPPTPEAFAAMYPAGFPFQ